MRLHHLSVTAFGPFADTVDVDFDDLSSAGLFLLTGATGSGKTSVLDAVCFALYGQVPGDRQSAKHLRCDQAPPDRASEVVLEVSLRGRRLRIARSPGWQRPKKRGTGTTPQQPAVRVTERVDGAWVPRASRLDEAGDLLGRLVGLTASQFCQVAMLPQGQFQAFLRADSRSRQALLQQLFRTTRFDEVEHWLKQRRRTLARDSAGHHDAVADLLSRTSEVAAQDHPDHWDLHDLAVVAGELVPWALARQQDAESVTSRSAAAAAAARGEARRASDLLDTGRTLARRQQEHADAAAESERLRAAAAHHDHDVTALRAGRDAAPVRSLHEVACASGRSLGAARAELTAALGGREADAEVLAAAERQALADATRAQDAEPRAALVVELSTVVAADQQQLAHLTTRDRKLADRADALPERIAVLESEARGAQRAAAALAAAEQRHQVLARRLQAARQVLVLDEALVEARGLARASTDAALSAKEAWLDVCERRLAGLAAELASGLAVGADCPVCGSCDHPHPAVGGPGAPDLAAEKAARSHYDDLEAERHARDSRVRDLLTRRDLALEQAAGRDPAAADDELAVCAVELADLRARAAEQESAEAALSAARAEESELIQRRADLAGERTSLQAALQARRERLAELESDLTDLLDGTGCASPAELATARTAEAEACARARAAVDRVAHAEGATESARHHAERAATAAGFADLEAALDAALDDAELARLGARVDQHRAALARCRAALSDPELRAAADEPPVDLPALEHERTRRADALAEVELGHRRAAERAERLARLAEELASACRAWDPVRSDLAVVSGLAALVDGTSPDNQWRMSLAGYVLSWRLGQVVAAANQRLLQMYDQRLTLEHTGERRARETRGGLGLLVRDDWSGVSRDPATLSGGETFMVSLALALGLADVIAHEAGGAELDTLFVDEGFGSLDGETLEKVMGTLDTLRDGGRVVGVVSHVAELRDRIPAQLHVRTGRDGSSVLTRRSG